MWQGTRTTTMTETYFVSCKLSGKSKVELTTKLALEREGWVAPVRVTEEVTLSKVWGTNVTLPGRGMGRQGIILC